MKGRIAFVAAAALLFSAFAIQLILHARTVSATSDEPIHIIAGLRHLRCRSFAANVEHPPLAKMVAALAAGPNVASTNWPCESSSWNSSETLLAIGGDVLSMPGGRELLTRTRLAISIFSLALAAAVFLAAWQMFGRLAGIIALALLAFEPAVIAHGSLVTTDMAATATIFMFAYALYRYVETPSTTRLLVAALCGGLMVATKHSTLAMLPIGEGLLVIALRRRPRELVKALIVIGAGALVLLWASYGFRYTALPKAAPPPLSTDMLVPEAYRKGLEYVFATSTRSTFILGQRYATGRWFYFPVAIAVKTSLALLLLSVVAAAIPRAFRRRRLELLFFLTPAVVYLVVGMTSNLNIGVRHILPVYPFLIVLAAGATAWCADRWRGAAVAIAVLLAFHAANSIRTYPDYIAFGNELWGGTGNTYKVLHDSNVDWGQDAYRVNEDARRHGEPCWYAHVGSGALTRLTPCSPLPMLGWTATNQLIRPSPPLINGRVYLSVNALPPRGDREYEPFRDARRAAQIGGSTLVYEGQFNVRLLSAVSIADVANWLLRQGRVAEGMRYAERSVELAPGEPRTHLALSAALRMSGRAAEAQRELETAARLMTATAD